jgi:hypothetical protein
LRAKERAAFRDWPCKRHVRRLPIQLICTQRNISSSTPACVNGNQPAIIQIGDSYADLGATIAGPQQDLNLGVQTYLNGTLTSNIVIDTTQAATDTIDYIATDQSDLSSTSTLRHERRRDHHPRRRWRRQWRPAVTREAEEDWS